MEEIENKHSSLSQLFDHNRVYIEGQINRLKSDSTISEILRDIESIKEGIDQKIIKFYQKL